MMATDFLMFNGIVLFLSESDVKALLMTDVSTLQSYRKRGPIRTHAGAHTRSRAHTQVYLLIAMGVCVVSAHGVELCCRIDYLTHIEVRRRHLHRDWARPLHVRTRT